MNLSQTIFRAVAAGTLAASLSRSYAQPPLTPEKTIPLPGVHGRIDHMAFDQRHNRLLVAALGSDALAIVDLQTGAVIHTIAGLAEPQGIGFDPVLNRLWVANGRDGAVRVYDAETFQPIRTLSLGDDADNIRRDPATGHILVGYGSGALAIFDSAATQLATIKLDAHPESFQLDPGSSRIFVNLPGSRKIAVLDRDKSRVVAAWPIDDARSNFPMALGPAGRLFIVCRNPALLLVLDSASGQVLQKLPTVGDSDDLFYDSTRKRIYVSGGEGAIAVYQQQESGRYAQLAQVKTTPGARTSLFVPGLDRLFLAVREQGNNPAAIQVFKTGN